MYQLQQSGESKLFYEPGRITTMWLYLRRTRVLKNIGRQGGRGNKAMRNTTKSKIHKRTQPVILFSFL